MVHLKEYTIEIHEEEEGGYSGRCLDVPGVNSQGETLEELEENMKEAIQLVLDYLEDKKKELKEQNKSMTVTLPA
jgi:predicted RNase H-like HicB family nuclease